MNDKSAVMPQSDTLLARFDDRPAMGTKVLGVPHKASVNFRMIGDVGPAKAEGVVVAYVLGEGARGPYHRE